MPDFTIMDDWTTETGRFFNKFDVENTTDVIVIGASIKTSLFGNRNAIGEYITTSSGKRLKVIGIMKYRYLQSTLGFSVWGENQLEWLNRQSFIPISTFIYKLGMPNAIQEITIKLNQEKDYPNLKNKVNKILLAIRKNEPVFNINSPLDETEVLKSMKLILGIIFYFISSISLLVGGIVIMNVLLASIKERTREIGVRMAIGARPIDIMLQFLIQSVIITFIGSIIGTLLAIASVSQIGKFLNLETTTNVSAIIVSIFTAIFVGLFFGIYPSFKASRVDPVKALRNE
jgi:putative ABC transport system permease protein